MRVSGIHVRALAEALKTSGVSTERFLERSGLDTEALCNPDAWYSNDAFDALMLLALELSQDEAFGLHWGEQSPMMQFDLLPPLVAQAQSLQGAIAAILRFQLILADRPEVEFQDHSGHATFLAEPLGVSARGLRLRSEMLAVSMARLLKHLGPAARTVLRRVTFTHPRPSHASEYTRIFGDLVSFEQSSVEVEFHYEMLDSPLLFRNDALHQMLEVQAERLLQRTNDERTYSERLKRLVSRELPAIVQMPDAARMLGMSERSLRRRLAEEGGTFTQLVEESQASRACELLDNPNKSLKEIASETGFTDASAFHRAFKRTTGTSPTQYRSASVKRIR